MQSDRHRSHLSRRSTSKRRSLVSAAGAFCESLESRLLLSTISWTNRNTFSGATDNRFDDVFGGRANQAIGVIDATLAYWARTIGNFNYSNGTNTYNVSISMNPAAQNTAPPGRVGANANVTGNIGNKPASATVGISWRTDTPPGVDFANGWYLDPTPMDNSEFGGRNAGSVPQTSAFTGIPTGTLGGADLFTGVLHELGHAMGLSSNSVMNAFATDTGIVDNVNTPASVPPAHLWRFDSPNAHVLWTAWDSGGASPNPTDSAGAQHYAQFGTSVFQNNRTYTGATALMNAGFTNRSIIDDNSAIMLQDAYGYAITRPSVFGTFYDRIDANGMLTIAPPTGNVPQTLDLQVSGSNLIVTLGVGAPVPGIDPNSVTSIIPLSSVQSINILMDDGSDTATIGALGSAIPIFVSMGAGNDVVNVNAGSGYDQLLVDTNTNALGGQKLVATNINITNLFTEALNFYTGDGGLDAYMPNTGNISQMSINGSIAGEIMNIHSLDTATPLNVFGNAGNDTISLGVDAGVDPLESAINVFGGNGDDSIWVGRVDFASVILQHAIAVFGEADNDTMYLGSNNADSVDVNITFDGGTHAGPTGDRVIINDQAPSYNISYTIANTVVTRDGINLPHTISYSNTEGITVNCGSGADSVNVLNGVTATITANGNNGNDNFTKGGGNLAGSSTANFTGGLGTDRLTFDDHLNPANAIFDIISGEIIFVGFTSGFESVGILAGPGHNQITFRGDLSQEFNIDAGGGDDTITLGYTAQANFANAVTVTGGAGNDNFLWQNASNTWSNFSTIGGLPGLHTYPFVLDGGSGFNSLSVDDSARGTAQYALSDVELYEVEGDGLVYGRDFTYDNMGAIGITCSNSANGVNVYGVSTDIDLGNQVTINMNGGADAAYVYPRNAAGGLSINGNIGIIGGTEIDSMTVQDGASALPINYVFSNPFGGGTQNIFGLGTQGGLGTAGVENLIVNAGTGNDTFAINQYKSGTGLTLNGSLGDDVCDFGNGDVAANVTSISSFLFNGMEGTDTFNLRNATPSNSFTYNAAANTTLQVSRTLPSSYFVSLEYYNTEQKVVYAGPAADTMNITNFASGELSFHGAGGNDLLNLPTTPDLLGRRVNFFGDAGTANQINQATNTKNATSILHVSQGSIGAFAGDNFFAPGGSISFNSVQTVALRMGGGPDTAYLQPDAVAAISIIGGNPPAAVGDTLNLAIANLLNPIINGTVASGSLTSNLKTVSWSGFETGPNVDASAPVVAEFELNLAGGGRTPPPHSITASFSEQVSFVTAASLSLTNTTTGQVIPAADIAVSLNFDTATYTFPNYPNGVLPDGAYQVQILGTGIADAFGNAMNGNSNIERFIWSAGSSGNDVFQVNRDPNTSAYRVFLNDSNSPAFVSPSATAAILLAGGAGDDSFTADYTNGNPIPPKATFYGDSGNDTIGVIGSTTDEHANFYDGSIQLVGAELNHLGMERVTYDTGGGVYDTVAINEIAVTLVGTQHFANLTINDGAIGLVEAASNSTVIARQLTMAPTATLDLFDNDLILDYTGATQLAAIQAMINSARAGGAWTGGGLTSTTARTANPKNKTLGAIEASEFKSINGPSALFAGEAIDNNAVLVKFTYYGDVDFNGVVDFDDYSRIDAGFNNNRTGWLNGDVDGNGIVDFDDYSLIDQAFNTQGPALRPALPRLGGKPSQR